MSMLKWPDKDPADNRPYVLDWEEALDTQTGIASSTWSVPSGITEGTKSVSGKRTQIWLSGGTLGETYTLENTITTQPDGWTLQQSVKVKVKDQ